jgi:hypothetical protein
MRCRDAKIWLNVQRDGDLELPTDTIATELQQHLRRCNVCRAFAGQQSSVEVPFHMPTAPLQASISTDQIMHAVKQQQYITQQLAELRQQQCLRIERMRTIGATGVAISIFALSSIPLLFVAMLLLQTDVVMNILALLNGVIEVFIILTQYLQNGLIVLRYNDWLLSGVAFALVVMMGMWLRLMRPPQEA